MEKDSERKADPPADAPADAPTPTTASETPSEERKGTGAPAQIDQQALFQQMMRANPEMAKQFAETAKAMQPHKFWDTQPVPKMREARPEEEKAGVIEEKSVEEVSKEQQALPKGFKWCTVDITDDAQADEVYKLLTFNYVEDDDNMFRFDYSVDFLRWILLPHNAVPKWLIGIRSEKTDKLLAFISGIPVKMSVYETEFKMAEINFLCVHKKLRAHRIAPVLIKEVTRQVNLKGIWQAVYTAGVQIPTPISTAKYFHRNLNFRKLVDVGFTSSKPGVSMAIQTKLYKLPSET